VQNLRLFQDVARCQSFSQAAELHGITQSAASQRISQLEKKLGVTLFDRSVRPLGLTEAGQIFFAGCEDILDRYDRLESRVASLDEDPKGGIRVIAIYSAGIDLLQQARERFRELYPQVALEVIFEKPDAVYQQVVGQQCELGIVSYPQRWRKVEIIPLRDERMVAVCQPSHELAKRESVHASELAGWQMATFDNELPAGRKIRQYLKEHGAAPSIAETFDNIDTLISAVRLTDHVAILPRRTVAREVEAGNVVAVPLEPVLHRPIGIIHRKRHGKANGLSLNAQRLIELLVEHAGPATDNLAQTQPANIAPTQTNTQAPHRNLLAGAQS